MQTLKTYAINPERLSQTLIYIWKMDIRVNMAFHGLISEFCANSVVTVPAGFNLPCVLDMLGVHHS